MARPRSEERKDAILAAAARVIASQGLGAPTAAIAKEAGVSNGSLFTYFSTKAELLNALYLELKGEMSAAALQGVPVGNDLRVQALRIWRNWLQWSASSPEKRRALRHLAVSEDISPQTREAANKLAAGIAAFIERVRMNGPMQGAPPAFVAALMSSVVEATVDFMVLDPVNADQHCATSFEALWRMLG